MALTIDPEVLEKLAPLAAAAAEAGPPPVGDVETRRVNGRQLFTQLLATRMPVNGVEVEQHSLTTADDAQCEMNWYRPSASELPGSAVLYLHGGGMIYSFDETAGLYDAIARGYVAASGVPMLTVDYRVAPEHPHPTPVEDCYAALQWLVGHAGELGVDTARLAVAGDSAGGGLAAAVSLLARDRGGPALAQQLLIYPMLDDRTVSPQPELPVELLTWTYDDNRTGWGALLGDSAGGDGVPAYAAPARADDLAGLPDTYIEVGDLDIFRDEDVAYACRLLEAGVPAELHLHPGCPHAFDGLAPEAEVTLRAFGDRVRRLRSL